MKALQPAQRPAAGPCTWLRDGVRTLLRWAAQQSGRRRTVLALASVSLADYFLPLLPNEGMALALWLFQRRWAIFIGLAFALASAFGAGLLAWAVGTLAGGLARWVSVDESQQARLLLAALASWGPWLLAAAAVFPSPPRAMVTAAALSGLHPLLIGVCVFTGKCVLYAAAFGGLSWLLRLGRPRIGRRRPTALGRVADRLILKLLAYARWLSLNASTARNSS